MGFRPDFRACGEHDKDCSMTPVTDEAVLAHLKKSLEAPYQDAIASAATLPEAEKLLAPHSGGLGGARERIRMVRDFLQTNPENEGAATIGGPGTN